MRTLLGRKRQLPDARQRGAAQVRAAWQALGKRWRTRQLLLSALWLWN